MPKKSVFVCQSCGAVSPKWAGKCSSCQAWNMLVEETASAPTSAEGKSLLQGKGGVAAQLFTLETDNAAVSYRPTGIGEFDHVLGGGIVDRSVILIGGDPGIGKSTLLLQVAAGFARQERDVVYISGEEAIEQIRLRANRLELDTGSLRLAAETNLRDILAMLDRERPALIIIDSIQTMWADIVDSSPGSVVQMRACAQELTHFAKRLGGAVILVGHVTKDGQIAGPRVIEHMVDSVLYFEGERGHHFRILRSVKNRFGAADEIGVFEMTGGGLIESPNPSMLFLSERDNTQLSGSAVFAGIEGTRPLLVEIQALVAPSPLGTPRRTAVGWDSARLSMLLAVLEVRCGLRFVGRDVFLNVAGGVRITEPAADLAVAAALVSAYEDKPVPAGLVIFGEVALSGAVRPAARTELRLREALRLGFERALAPKGSAEVNSDTIVVDEIKSTEYLIPFLNRNQG